MQTKTVVDAHCCFGFLNFSWCFCNILAEAETEKFKKPKQRGIHDRFSLHNDRFILHFVNLKKIFDVENFKKIKNFVSKKELAARSGL